MVMTVPWSREAWSRARASREYIPFQVKAIEELKLQLKEAAARETPSGDFHPPLVDEEPQFCSYPEPACLFGSDSSYVQTVAEPLTHSSPSASIHAEGVSICEATADVNDPSLPDGVLGSWTFGSSMLEDVTQPSLDIAGCIEESRHMKHDSWDVQTSFMHPNVQGSPISNIREEEHRNTGESTSNVATSTCSNAQKQIAAEKGLQGTNLGEFNKINASREQYVTDQGGPIDRPHSLNLESLMADNARKLELLQEIENTTEDAVHALETFLQDSSPSRADNVDMAYDFQGPDVALSKSPPCLRGNIMRARTNEGNLATTSRWLNSPPSV
eukprot:jgi/Botrbrau1/21394/Bobra.0216s0014.2